MSSQSPEKCPVRGSMMELLDHDYAQVAETFADFEELGLLTDRGGVVRDGEEPRSTQALWGASLQPGYHVESTFTEPQQAYVAVTVAALTKLSHGRVLGDRDIRNTSMSEHVQDRFLANVRANPRFALPLLESTTDVIDTFSAVHPNLAPALEAMHKSRAATAGIVNAVGIAKHALARKMKGEEDVEATEFLERGALGKFFTGQHPVQGWELSHEVWCPGDPLARAIIREAGYAAAVLVNTPRALESYGPYSDLWTVSPGLMNERIDHSINRAVASARPA